jgi:hypothetical protein
MKRSIIAAVVASVCAAGIAQAQMATPNTSTPNPNPGTGSVTPLTNPKGAVANPNTTAAEGAVKEKLRAAGFTGVSNLERMPDGTWKGRAMKDNAQVAIQIDPAGNIAFQ